MKLPDPSRSVEVRVSLPEGLIGSRVPDPFDFLAAGTESAPLNSESFNCYAFNIMGPGIGRSDGGGGNEPPTDQIVSDYASGRSRCSYPGITSPPLSVAGGVVEAKLVVPAGANRILQMVGIQDPNNVVCSRTDIPVGQHPDGTPNQGDHYYRLGDKITGLFKDTVVDIPNTYDTLTTGLDRIKQRLDCGGLILEFFSVASENANSYCDSSVEACWKFKLRLRRRSGELVSAFSNLTLTFTKSDSAGNTGNPASVSIKASDCSSNPTLTSAIAQGQTESPEYCLVDSSATNFTMTYVNLFVSGMWSSSSAEKPIGERVFP